MFLSGVAHLLLGDVDTAETRLTDATELTDEGDAGARWSPSPSPTGP